MDTLGQRIKDLRVSQSFTIEELHLRSSVAMGTISELENEDTNITIGTLRKLLTAMHVKPGTFRI